jgi:hypothetical protein
MTTPETHPNRMAGVDAPGRGGAATERGLLALLILALIGVGVTDFSAGYGLRYWLAMVPIFGGVSIFFGWSRARRRGENVSRAVTLQILHWCALPLALAVVYVLEETGRLNQEDAGLISLLVLGLTTLLAGVHFDWRLGLIGLVLCVASVCAALLEEFFWVLLIPVVIGGVILFIMRKRSA